VVAGPEQADRAALGQLGQRVDGLLQRGGPVVDVGVVEVQPLAAELAQAGLGVLADRLGAKALQCSGLGSPATRVRAPTLVATTTSSVTPRDRRQRPMTRSLSPASPCHWP
jgi:hypothetical protein